ncbi:GntR family transcriptional regulator [Exiguobacterium sp. Leaf187]|uniref:GntR family transcriptional regulator n=3 Tax=Exiguobacterium TaxID=33986 RepID=A0A0V8GK97_9BACL|nr:MULTISPECIES: GntR family transcriptional regulator [Exiguobacterium]HBQ77294.1 GntR family transcriptional regulator [Exiguobacterium sp.]AHA30055.1 GntR family transcriptional regulator [Exiguobacterium sp. MH3]AOT01027.1 GntR family transcriptional regulator [Exiguobacterium sp. U13-1]KNH36305.1 GntR family transcriptional regulator [Exiguobacterium acetylicum]KQS19299.1 GntR family transcriptional regulator [Exiguobacterium sp. Leaf187]
MSIKLDHRLLYLRVIEKIKSDIDDGVYKEGEKLPSEFELSKQLGVSRATLREALRILEDENIVIRKHGVGTFINARPPFTSGIEELYSVTEMIARAGMVPTSEVLSSEMVQPTERDRERFQLGPDELVYRIERIRLAGDVPVVYCIDKIPSHYIKNEEQFTSSTSLFDALEKELGRRVTHAVTHIEPRIDPKIAEQLHTDQPLLALRQTHYDELDRSVLFSANYFRADKFDFHVIRKRV